MPNWTYIELYAEGIDKLPIFTEYKPGHREFDYNKIVPMPEYTRNTIAPVMTHSVLCYLLKEHQKEEALKKYRRFGFTTKEEIADLESKTLEELLELTDKPETIGYGEDAREISAYELGKNYFTSKEKTGCWEWYDWAYENWGVKWNATDTSVGDGFVSFTAPWGYPDKVFIKLAEMFPDKEFTAEIQYEDEYDTIYYVDFSSEYWEERSEPLNGEDSGELSSEVCDNMEFRLGLYDQVNVLYSEGSEKAKSYGIALEAYKDGRPYATVTVNIPSMLGSFCEVIGIKNAAYVDIYYCPWARMLLEKGIATDMGLTKHYGVLEYPLWQFNEEWLKSLVPVTEDRTYSMYEKKLKKQKM